MKKIREIMCLLLVAVMLTGMFPAWAAAKECGMPLATFRYRAEIYEKSVLL